MKHLLHKTKWNYSEIQRDLLYYGVESEQFARHFPDMKPPKTVSQGKFEGMVTGIRRRYLEKGSEFSEASLFHDSWCIYWRLVDAGNTVILVEHHMDLIAASDWIVDIGPGGGAAGGAVVAEGTPEAVAQVEKSHTGRFLKELRYG
ncbi:hypothetical protein ABDI30_15660 [Paenibacillus cisolokensis]